MSAFGFGGTNFHAVLEEYVPGRGLGNGHKAVAVGADLGHETVAVAEDGGGREQDAGSAEELPQPPVDSLAPLVTATATKQPPRGVLVLGAGDRAGLALSLRRIAAEATEGRAPGWRVPQSADLAAPERLAIDYGDHAELADRAARALHALDRDEPQAWRMLRGRGIFRGRGAPGKVAFLYTGQGSQYVNMLAALRRTEPVVAATFDEADAVMGPLLGRPLTDFIFVDPADTERVAAAERDLRRTEITQPAVLAVDLALTRLLAEFGITPDLVMGHSLGEYGALVAAGSLTFAGALEAVSARGQEMANLTIDDTGLMVAVSAPLEAVEKIVASIDGNVVVANVNSTTQAVLGGATEPVLAAERACEAQGFSTTRLQVSHAFHTSIVAPASEPLRRTLQRIELRPPRLPVISNVTGDFYPSGEVAVPEMLDLLARQVASPVQFVKGLRHLYEEGARVFVEVGPKWALRGFASDVLGDEAAVNLATNHPKAGDVVSFNQALCGLYAAGLGFAGASEDLRLPTTTTERSVAATPAHNETRPRSATDARTPDLPEQTYAEMGRLLADFLDKSRALYEAGSGSPPAAAAGTAPVVITGAALGTPGTPRVFDDTNLARLLNGEQFIDVIPTRLRGEILDRHITRLVKSDQGGSFETIDSPADVLKLAARSGAFEIDEDFGVDRDRALSFGRTTQLAIGAGFDALRDAGIPLVMRYRTTHLGTKLPERWGLPDDMRDDTGVIFASAFPGLEELAVEAQAFAADHARQEELAELEAIRARVEGLNDTGTALAEIDRRIHDLRKALADTPYRFDRRFLFRVLSMGHSQFADLIGARGPNTQVNSACASTTQAVSVAEDWIRAGRCRRVVIVAADDVTSDGLLGWIGAGFLASGAAATDEDVTQSALPFDRRRHGMILGMGAAAMVVEATDVVHERGLRPICEVLSTVTANSAFHGTRLDVDHIGDVMETLVAAAEMRAGIDRRMMAGETVFVSHETYTPARGGSASAEISALRRVFGTDADRIVIANTKGFTGHPMGVGLEDVVAVKALETGIVPPLANFKEADPELGPLNLSTGGAYPVQFALRLAAGFGSQVSMMLLRWTPMPDGCHRSPDELGYRYRIEDQDRFDDWLRRISGDATARLEVSQRRLRIAQAQPAEATPTVVATPSPGLAEAPARALAPVPLSEPAAPTTATTSPAGSAVDTARVVAEPDVPADSSPSADAAAERIVALVAEQTGYPAEMLAMDLDLEADLGIDTVKQAELFATIRQEYGIERDDTLKLRDYPTLNHVLRFVQERSPQPLPGSAGPAVGSAPPAVRASTPSAPVAAEPDRPGGLVAVGGRRGRAHRGPGGRTDRLPGRDAGHGPRPRSRPRHRHRQASGAVRDHPPGVRDRARRHAEAAGLSHLEPRAALRPRTLAT